MENQENHNSGVAIAVMGATGSGKTTFINMCSGSSFRVSRGLQSCTSDVQVAPPFALDGRIVTLIDTPGFDDTTKSDTDILRLISAFLATAYESGKKLAGVIYIHRISDVRMGGISTRNFRMFRQLCGENAMKNVVIMTNRWGDVTLEIGEEREAELISQDMFFKPVLDMGALIMRHDNTLDSAHMILSKIVQNQPLSLKIQRELVDEKKNMSETAAGEELNRELNKLIQKHEREMRQLRKEMDDAIREKDEQTKRELEIETGKLKAEIDRIQMASQRLASDFGEEKIRMGKRMQDLSESTQQEAERAASEYNRQLSALQSQLDSTSSDFSNERMELLRKMAELNSRPIVEHHYHEGGCTVQ